MAENKKRQRMSLLFGCVILISIVTLPMLVACGEKIRERIKGGFTDEEHLSQYHVE